LASVKIFDLKYINGITEQWDQWDPKKRSKSCATIIQNEDKSGTLYVAATGRRTRRTPHAARHATRQTL